MSLAVVVSSQSVSAQVPAPRDVLGFHPTDDQTIADWKQISNYFAKLDKASARVTVREIGRTTLGRSQIAAFISSEANIKNLEKIREMNSAAANHTAHYKPGDNPESAKAIVAISCSIHSTEIVASQMSMLLAHELATADDDKTKRILENTVLILIPSANPDGIDIVADWYRKTLGTRYEGTSPPELYHHYAGHDNNRDWFMMNLAETRNITKLFWQEWFPHIVYDVHQQGTTGTRMTIPPFFDPPNPRIPAVLLREIGLVGYKIAADLARAGETGVATNATYDTWWHGGFRSAPYYHNSIGILSEAASASLMTPVEINKDQLAKQRPTRGLKNPLETSTNFPEAWNGGSWGPRDIARIELLAARSVLDLAARFKDRYIANSRMLAAKNLERNLDDPVAFVIPAGQPKAETVSRFLEILMWQGIEVHLMAKEIEAATAESDRENLTEIPGGSFIVLTSSPQRNNILSLFEKQVYPDRINAAGEAEVPYDVSGWTLPLQMGIEYQAVWRIQGYREDSRRAGSEDASDGFRRMRSISEVRKALNLKKTADPFDKLPNPLKTRPRIGLYKGHEGSMDEGWTRLVLDNHRIPYRSIPDSDIRAGNLNLDVLILPSQSEREIVSGLTVNRYPEAYAGGITEAGVGNLKRYVEDGGKLVCFDDSCEMVIKRFALPVKNVLNGLDR
ncbi:MAG: M14 family metallopeptidase, partial [Acidobacteriota bacterium]|nr:M14 family metallopeptidase [Acidobacteriota bacterium]